MKSYRTKELKNHKAFVAESRMYRIGNGNGNLDPAILLSIQEVADNYPNSRELLRLLAFFHPERIPLWLVKEIAFRMEPPLNNLAEDENTLNEAIQHLVDFELIEACAHADCYRISEQVQRAIKIWIDEAGNRQQLREALVFSYSGVFNYILVIQIIIHNRLEADALVGCIENMEFHISLSDFIIKNWNEDVNGINHETLHELAILALYAGDFYSRVGDLYHRGPDSYTLGRAIRLYERSYLFAGACNNFERAAESLRMAARACFHSEDRERSRFYYEEVLRIYNDLGIHEKYEEIYREYRLLFEQDSERDS